MNDRMLSQDEINALLAVSAEGNDDEEDGSAEETTDKIEVSDYLSIIEEDTIGEIGNISFGSSATTLSTLLNQKVDITTPTVTILRKSDLRKEFSFNHVKIQVNYVEGFAGENLFVIKYEDAAVISDLMLGGDGTSPDSELSDIHLSAVQEAMNQMMGAAATSMSTIFNKMVNISPPTIEIGKTGEDVVGDLTAINLTEEILVKVSFQLKVGTLIDSSIMQLIPFPFAHEMVEELLNETEDIEEYEVSTNLQTDQAKQEDRATQPKQEESNVVTNDEQVRATQYLGTQVNKTTAEVHHASFAEFEQIELGKNEQRNLENLLDIPLKVTVELGRTKRPIKDILDLSVGSIIELDKLAGEPVDILVNQKLIAQGEVVVIDENFGVRVTEIISKADRLMNLN